MIDINVVNNPKSHANIAKSIKCQFCQFETINPSLLISNAMMTNKTIDQNQDKYEKPIYYVDNISHYFEILRSLSIPDIHNNNTTLPLAIIECIIDFLICSITDTTTNKTTTTDNYNNNDSDNTINMNNYLMDDFSFENCYYYLSLWMLNNSGNNNNKIKINPLTNDYFTDIFFMPIIIVDIIKNTKFYQFNNANLLKIRPALNSFRCNTTRTLSFVIPDILIPYTYHSTNINNNGNTNWNDNNNNNNENDFEFINKVSNCQSVKKFLLKMCDFDSLNNVETFNDLKKFKGSCDNLINKFQNSSKFCVYIYDNIYYKGRHFINDNDDMNENNRKNEYFTIFIKSLNGKTFTLRNVCKWMTIDNITTLVQIKEGFPKKQQRYIFRGKGLLHEKTLQFYNIVNESTIHLVFRLPGGMDNNMHHCKSKGLQIVN